MTKKLTKQDIIDWAIDKGWELDNWGHLQKKVGDKEYRFKLSNTAMRYEVKVHHPATIYSRASSEWMRLRSGYYKDLHITAEGKLTGLK